MHTETRPETASQKLSGGLAIVLGLMVFSVFLNYVDRGNLSIAAPLIEDELHLSPAQLGFLLSSFFWTYGLFQILAGELVDRLNVGWVLAGGFLLWSAATGVTGLLHGFTALFVVRLVLGIGESVAYPAYSRILAQYYPEGHRSRANGLLAAGLAGGPAFGMLAGGFLMSRFGWRSFFVVLGFVSLLWLLPWLLWMPRGPVNTVSSAKEPSPSTWEILSQRSAWGTFCSLFCANYVLYLNITWLPSYLVRERHFSLDAMGETGGAIFGAMAISAILCGRYGDRWLASGASATRVRKTFLIAGMMSCGSLMFLSTLVSPTFCIVLLILSGAGAGSSASNFWATTQTLAGPHASGRWTGLQCAFANYSGVVAPIVAGYMVKHTGHFSGAFGVAMGFGVLGAVCAAFFVGPIEPVLWGNNKVLTGVGRTAGVA